MFLPFFLGHKIGVRRHAHGVQEYHRKSYSPERPPEDVRSQNQQADDQPC